MICSGTLVPPRDYTAGPQARQVRISLGPSQQHGYVDAVCDARNKCPELVIRPQAPPTVIISCSWATVLSYDSAVRA